jgi:hypothetical protein
VRLREVRSALMVSVMGWATAAALWMAGATGWLEAAALAAVVLLLQFQRLTPDERRWVIERLRRSPAEVAP